MTMTQVQFLPLPGQPGLGGQASTALTGLEGLFSQLVGFAQLGESPPQANSQPLSVDVAANIAEPPPLTLPEGLPLEPVLPIGPVKGLEVPLSEENTISIENLLPRSKQTKIDDAAALQILPSQLQQQIQQYLQPVEPVPSLFQPVAKEEPHALHQQQQPYTSPLDAAALPVIVRSDLMTLQSDELKSLIEHENVLLQQLGFTSLTLASDIEPSALTQIYMQAGLTPDEAAVRVETITQMLNHLNTTPQQPLTIAVPSSVVSASSTLPEIQPLSPRPQSLLAAVEAATQAILPEGEDLVSQILSLDDTTTANEETDLEAALLSANITQAQSVAATSVPVNEAKAAVDALVELAMPEKKLSLDTRPVQTTVDAAATTAEGQIIDTALNEQPAAHLLASVERSQVTGGVATQSGAAISLAPGYNQSDTSADDHSQRPTPEITDITRTNSDVAAASFDRFLGQKLEAQLPVPTAYNAQGRAPTPTEQVDISIRQLANSGGGEVRIQLAPEELGRVDIRLEIHNSQVRGVILVERPEVMQDLARDLKHLQQALTASGLTVADNALSFQMQNQGGDQGQNQERGNLSSGGLTEVAGVDDSGLPLPAGPWRDVTRLVDVNI